MDVIIVIKKPFVHHCTITIVTITIVHYTVHANLTFLQSWTPRRVPKWVATHAPLCNTLPSNNLSSETLKIPALKGLNYF